MTQDRSPEDPKELARAMFRQADMGMLGGAKKTQPHLPALLQLPKM